jgi:site-specific DNA recombinase
VHVDAKTHIFLYVRKSTDVEDKQVLSIAAQMSSSKSSPLVWVTIVEVIVEKQHGQKAWTPKFNKMLERIEAGEANGILAWLPDRLSRNTR